MRASVITAGDDQELRRRGMSTDCRVYLHDLACVSCLSVSMCDSCELFVRCAWRCVFQVYSNIRPGGSVSDPQFKKEESMRSLVAHGVSAGVSLASLARQTRNWTSLLAQLCSLAPRTVILPLATPDRRCYSVASPDSPGRWPSRASMGMQPSHRLLA